MSSVDPGLHYPIDLNSLPRRWRVCYVGDAIPDIQPGFASGVHNRAGEGIPHLRPMNVDRQGRLDLSVVKYVANSNGPRLQRGDVLFNNTNSPELIGKTTSIETEEEFAFSNHMTRLRPPEGVYGRFVAHQLHFVWMSGYFKHRCVKHVNQASIASSTLAKSIPLILPPFEEQREIVAEIENQFTRLEAGIAGLRRVQANLKRYRAAVLKAACEGKLVPTEAELARQEGRSFESGTHLLDRILTERRQKWNGKGKYKEPRKPDAANLPELPAGWVWGTFEQLSMRVTVGHVGPMKHEYVPRGIPFLRSQNVRENRFDYEGLLFIPPDFHAKLLKSVIMPDDLAVVRSGNVGVTCVIPDSIGEANCADLVLIQRPFLVPQFGAYYMNSLAKRLVESGKVGVALTHFNTKSVAGMPVPVPPLAEQQRIVAEVEWRLSVVEEIEAVVNANLHRATRLRQSVLDRAFKGDLLSPAAKKDGWMSMCS